MRNPREKTHHSTDMVFVLVLFACLVIVGVMLIAMGTGVYRNVLDSMNRNDHYRTATAYITQKVRQNQDADAIHAGTLDGYSAITLRQNIGGTSYTTWLYCDGTHLKELLARSDNDSISAEAGNDILEMQDMEVTERDDDTLMIVMTTADGTKQKLRIAEKP